MSGLADISVLLGLAAGLGVWYFMHESGDANAGDVEIKTTGAVGRVQEGAGQLVDSLTESASSLSSSAVQKVQGLVAEVQGAVDKNPWVFVAGGLLVGSLLAVLIPQTDSENRMLGQVREHVVDRAQELVQGTLQSGRVRAAVDGVKGFSG